MVKYITVGFSRSKKTIPIASWAIQLYQRTWFSHVYIKISIPGLNENTIIHASGGMVHALSQTQFDKKHQIVREFKIKLNKPININALHSYLGQDYGFTQNIGIIISDIFKKFGKTISNPWKRGFNCSEFVMIALQESYPDIFSKFDPNTITPKDIYGILTSWQN